MDKLFLSISQLFRERTSSSLYRTYITIFILWNWQTLYLVFFGGNNTIDQQTKLDLIQKKLFFNSYFPNTQIDKIYIAIINFIWGFLIPLVITLAVIKWLPILHNWVYEHDINNYFKRKTFYEKKRLESEKDQSKDLSQLVDEKKKQKVAQQELNRVMTDEEKWTEEYITLSQNNLFKNKYNQIVKTIYENSGYIESTINYRQIRNADSDIIALTDTKGLIEINGEQIEFTQKGKFMTSIYLQNKQP